MGRVEKLLKSALVHENFLDIQHKINKFKKKSVFSLNMRKLASDIWMLN